VRTGRGWAARGAGDRWALGLTLGAVGLHKLGQGQGQQASANRGRLRRQIDGAQAGAAGCGIFQAQVGKLRVAVAAVQQELHRRRLPGR